MFPPDLTTSRRMLVGAAVALSALPARLLAQSAPRLIAGTYVREGGPGLVPLEAGPVGWSSGQPLTIIRNASFGVRSAATGLSYLLDEQETGTLSVYDQAMRQLVTVSTLGADPCHAALSADGLALAVANYSSGSVAWWRLDRATGLPIGGAQRIVHGGSGPDRERQATPHAHWVGFDASGQRLHSVDLGADAIFAHAIATPTGATGATSVAYRATAGSGSRHLAYHPRLPIAYLVAELANTVTILSAAPDGAFAARGVVSTLPKGVESDSAAAHIALNRAGTRLFVSNRGHDSIAMFAVGSDGSLELIEHVGCGGHWPRLFLLLEDRGEMLVANERSGNVSRLRVGPDGRLGAATPGVKIPGVVFLSA